MTRAGTLRSSVKAFVRGQASSQLWLFPIFFSLGSRLESLSPREFFSNPTKIVSALRQMRTTLKIDGLPCYYDPFLEAEALGCQLFWGPDGPSPVPGEKPSDVESIRRRLGATENILEKGRIRIAAEVVRRLKGMMTDDPALMVRLTGPLTLAQRVFRSQSSHGAVPSQDEVELAAEVTAVLSRGFVEAGADVVFLVEEMLPLPDRETCERWGELLDPIINVIRFYEALPVLLLSDPDVSADTLGLLCSRTWECVLCPTLSEAGLLPAATWRSQAAAIGLGLPASAFVSGCDLGGFVARILKDARELNPILLTTSADVPIRADLKHLAVVISTLREALRAADWGR